MRRPKSGDVLEIEGDGKLAYVVFVGRHPLYGEGVVVRPSLSETRPEIGNELFQDGFFVFYPASAGLRGGLSRIVGSVSAPLMPTAFRRPLEYASDGRVVAWIIADDSGAQSIKYSLTRSENLLPIGSVWSHELLLRAVTTGWRPERSDEAAPIDVVEPVDRRQPLMLHYLYFPSRVLAGQAAKKIRALGLKTEVSRSADGSDWLLLVQDEFATEGAAQREYLEDIARASKGEYDGWEVKIPE